MKSKRYFLVEQSWKRLTEEGNSPVDERKYSSPGRFPSITGHVKSCENPARPWAKAKYSLVTDSELVPRGKVEK